MTKKQAKELSILKWEWIVKKWRYVRNNFNNFQEKMYDDIPELRGLIAGCGYCEKYIIKKTYLDYDCSRCPLFLKKVCYNEFNDKYIYSQWYRNPTKENAQRILEAIKES